MDVAALEVRGDLPILAGVQGQSKENTHKKERRRKILVSVLILFKIKFVIGSMFGDFALSKGSENSGEREKREENISPKEFFKEGRSRSLICDLGDIVFPSLLCPWDRIGGEWGYLLSS